MTTNPSTTSASTTGTPAPSPATATKAVEVAVFGAGCFWGVEHIYRTQVPGVVDAVSGYAGGKSANPTYKEVCEGTSGHVEVVQVTFDTTKTSYEKIVDAFFRMHDPTQADGQGPDLGEQYRSVIYFASPEQKRIAEAVKVRRQAKHRQPIVTTIEPAQTFYKAEEYHQDYYERKGTQPYCHTLRPE